MGNSEDEPYMSNMELHDVDIEAIKHLVDALAALQAASSATMHGFVSDYCENAAVDVRKALRAAGT